MTKRISRRITVYNFIMTCIIVFYHMPAVMEKSYSVVTDLATIAMSFFFFVTAFLLFQGYSLKKYPQKIWSRVKGLLIPYCVWNIIAVLFYYFKDGVVLTNQFLASFIFKQSPPNGPLWYMFAVFALALVSPIFFFLLRNKRSGLVISMVIAIAVSALCAKGCAFVDFAISYGYLARILTYMPAYVVGAYFGLHAKKIKMYEAISYYAVALVLSYIVGIYFGDVCIRTLLRLLPILILYVFPSSEKKSNGRCAFMIYVLHYMLISLLFNPVLRLSSLIKLPMTDIMMCLVPSLICMVIVVVIGIVLYYMLKDLAPKLLSIITGGR